MPSKKPPHNHEAPKPHPKSNMRPHAKPASTQNSQPKTPPTPHRLTLHTPTLLAQVKAEAELTRELKELTRQVEKIRNMELIANFKKPGKFLWFSFLKGLMMGFGSVLGASLLVGIAVYLISQIQLVPVIGDFVKDVLKQIDNGQVFEQTK